MNIHKMGFKIPGFVGMVLLILILSLFLSGQSERTAQASFPQEFFLEVIADTVHRVETPETPIPILFYFSNRFGDEGVIIKFIALYDVSNGSNPPSWDNPQADNTVILRDRDIAIQEEADTVIIISSFINDGATNGSMPDWTPLTPANLGYSAGSTISFTARIYYDLGIWGEASLDKDLKVHVGEEPLPTFSDWYYGDTHYHTWKTFNAYELGGPTEMVAASAIAMGLKWLTATDHSCDLIMTGHESDWDDLGDEVIDLTTDYFVMIRGEEVSLKGYDVGTMGFGLRHMLTYEHDRCIEGDQLGGPWYIHEILGKSVYQDNLADQGGFAYSAHPGHVEGNDFFNETEGSWPDYDNDIAIQYNTFRGLEFLNDPSPYHAESANHPWGNNPHSGDWITYKSSWRDSTLEGAGDWDRLLSKGLPSWRKVFSLSGSDAHGDFNYFVHVDVATTLTGDYDCDAEDYAIGKGRTMAYLPGGLTQANVLDALRNGRTVITDGPIMIFGIDVDHDGSFYGDNDLLISEGPGTISSAASIIGSYKSTAEYGQVKCIRFYAGTQSTGRNPILLASITTKPNAYEGSFSFPISAISELVELKNTNLYLRAQCYTFDPDSGVPVGGNPTNASYNAQAFDYDYRCWTNPIWIRISD
ncbi:hypothetical protein ACFL27_17935 [candidate division CSSED10-310 bacterium]|uniref:Polymerase/histidinol phosphatase N-terminal domain-containing protein n=1 Tax=candidate division CSSED10-310 bacterium TaxID=2855610 RepID=A0ABV6Z0X2_UNCC1